MFDDETIPYDVQVVLTSHDVTGPTHLISHTNHQVWKIGSHVVKFGNYQEWNPEREVHYQNAYCGREVCHVLATTSGRPIVVSEYLGDRIDPATATWHLMGQALRRVHERLDPIDGTLSGYSESVIARAYRRLDENPSISTRARSLVCTLIDSVRPLPEDHLTVVHTDPNVTNWVLGSDGPALIDWENVMIAPPEVDIASFLWSAAQYDVDPNGFLDGYGTFSHQVLRDALVAKILTGTTFLLSRYGEEQVFDSALPTIRFLDEQWTLGLQDVTV